MFSIPTLLYIRSNTQLYGPRLHNHRKNVKSTCRLSRWRPRSCCWCVSTDCTAVGPGSWFIFTFEFLTNVCRLVWWSRMDRANDMSRRVGLHDLQPILLPVLARRGNCSTLFRIHCCILSWKPNWHFFRSCWSHAYSGVWILLHPCSGELF